MTDSTKVTEVESSNRFELTSGDQLLSFASYQQSGLAVVVPHVETMLEHRGQGNADRLMAGMLDLIEESGRTITPLCPFAAEYLRNHPERHAIVTSHPQRS